MGVTAVAIVVAVTTVAVILTRPGSKRLTATPSPVDQPLSAQHTLRGASAASNGVARTVNACSLLARTEVRAVIGAGDPPERSQVGDGADECTWLTTGIGPSVVIQAGQGADQFGRRFNTTDQDISGIGDQAAGDSLHPGEVLARRGSEWVEVFVQNTSADRDNAESLVRDALRSL